MNLYKKKIYKNQLQHAATGQKWKNHKYLYIDANGNYVYPEDVKNNAKSKVQGFVADQKQKLKDKKYLRDEKHRKYPNLEKANVTSPGGKRVNQITSSHQEGTKKTTALSYQSTHDPISNKVVKVKRDFDANGNQIGVGYSTESSHLAKKKQRNKIDQQRKSAHAGYEADKKNFPDGGSTEELEYQKKKTAARKAEKKYDEERRKINQQASSAHEGYWNGMGPVKNPVGPEELERQIRKTSNRKTEKANLERRRKQKKAKSETPTRTISGVSITTKSPTKKSRTSTVTVKTTQPKQKNETAYERQHRERAESTKAGNKKLRKTGGDLTRAWMKSKFGGSVVDSVDTLKDSSDKSKKKKKKVAKK